MRILDELETLNLPDKYQLPMYTVLAKHRLIKAVARAFGLSGLVATPQPVMNADGQKIGTAHVEYTWYARVTWWQQPIIVAQMRCSRYMANKNVILGALLAHKKALAYDFVGEQPYRCVQMAEGADQIVAGLRNLNLFEPESPIIPGNVSSPHFSLNISTGNGTREINYSGGPIKEESWIKLWDSIVGTVETLRGLYQDADLDAFFAAGSDLDAYNRKYSFRIDPVDKHD